jgi:ribosomal protein S18 acetylase RimI-like enzyme
MGIEIRCGCEGIDWALVPRILAEVGMSHDVPAVHERSFRNSAVTVFAFDDGGMIGFGRAVSDGERQAAIYDIAVLPAYQGRGIGRAIMEKVLEGIPNCNAILYANTGKEAFYEQFGFRKMKTAMALFRDTDMAERKGFIE